MTKPLRENAVYTQDNHFNFLMSTNKEFVLESNHMLSEDHILAWRQMQFFIILIQDPNIRI